MAEGDKISRAFFAFIMLGTLIAGTLNNITVKEQDETKIDGRPFYHPFVQTLIMFIAEFACLVAFHIGLQFNTEFRTAHEVEEKEAEENGIKTKNTWWIPAIPAVCDITGTCMQMVSISFIDQSIYVMLRGGVPVVTAGLSIIFLKKVLSKAQYVGLSLSVLGITIVGTYGYLTGQHSNSNVLIGLICVLLSLFTTGIQFVIEEKILAVNHIHPLRMVGLEGMFGICYTAIAIAIANHIPCDASNIESCNANGALEDFSGAMSAIFGKPLLLMWVLLGMFSLGFFNFFGMSVTKHVSSLARSILLITTTVIIWIYNLVFIGTAFHWQQLIGFLILVTGNLIYQRIIKIPALEAPKEETPIHTGLVRKSAAKASMGKVSMSDPVTHDLLVREHDDD